ncbi:cell wall metabolism sensor histidine kinase WalK [Paenibacillus sp. YN15]|uniref:sensor histidine kinase n=1 Tax=Paenibacillus sp. YN15 TaxID=1742774 RepID=UPI00215C6B81|nr:HAMP domain-containing sensor histidine kinase [Paenibacillus sp. YN15]
MKLVYQINIAFAVSLILVLSVTGAVIHFVLMDHFIGAQKEDLKNMGAAMTARLGVAAVSGTVEVRAGEETGGENPEAPFLVEGGSDVPSVGQAEPSASPLPAADLGAADHLLSFSAFTVAGNDTTASGVPMSISIPYSEVRAILTDREGKVVTANWEEAAAPLTTIATSPSTSIPPVNLEKIWNGTDTAYVSRVEALPTGTLTLLTPVSRIKAIEQELLRRLLIIFAAGGVTMAGLSLVFTRKLIRPLMLLKQELEKIKERHFAQVRPVGGSGEIGAVSKAVYEMAGELNRFIRVQKEFFQNASHELKTPLMSISGYAEGIREGIFEGAQVERGLDIIVSECARVKKLVMEMTLLAKLDSAEDIFRVAPVSLAELVQEVVERINPMLAAKGLSVRVALPEEGAPVIRADGEKLLQALLNVAANAVRYAQTGILIRVSMVQGEVRLSVSDDGCGFPEELLPVLFHRFVKGKDGESGLGLAISRAIVEGCGGAITAGNRPEGGAVISMTLPAAA